MKSLLIFILAILVIQLWAYQEEPVFEQGRAAFKITDTYKWTLRLGNTTTGIGELDDLLRRLDIHYVRPRFATNPKLSSSVDLSTILEVGFSRLREPLGICNALDRLECVEWAEPIYIDQVLEAPNDYFFPFMRYMDALQAQQAWEIHKGENGTEEVVIAIVDTGTNWKHPDLAGNIWNNLGEDANGNGYTMYHNGTAWVYDSGDLNGIDDDENGKTDDLIGWNMMYDINGTEYYDPYASSGHGTNVAGIANSSTNNGMGVCSIPWNVKTMPIRCTPAGYGSIYRGYDGIIYAAENGADVINCSWGGIYSSQANQAAVNYAWSLGSIIVAASGNNNNQIPLYPSSYEKIVSVGTVRNNGTQTVCTFGPFVDVCAPMDSIYTTLGNGYGYAGIATSYASPIATGLCALIKSHNPDWTNEEVVQQLVASCEDLNPYNPTKINMLGYGHLNALAAMNDTLLVPTPGLKLAVAQYGIPTETNGNKAIEPGEQFSFNFRLRNYAWLSGSDNLNLTLSCTDPDVTILNGSYSCSIGPDSAVDITNAFLVQVSPSATAQYVTFTITCSADEAILNGASIRYDVLINGPGIYIWEGFPNILTTSGTYINSTLTTAGYNCALGNNYNTNGTYFPLSFTGFDAVFLSFGAEGSYYYCYRFSNMQMLAAIREYLESGGRLYLEGGDAIGYDVANYFPEIETGLDGDDILYPLLGISAAEDGSSNVISQLSGANGWHTLGLSYTGSTQSSTYCASQDKYTPNANGIVAFTEDNYGTVAVQSIGSYGQRTFLMSYTLKCLNDAAFPSTKLELLTRILDFFGDADLRLPEVAAPAISITEEDSLLLDWTYPFGVDSFEVLSGDSPTSDFTTESETQQTQITLPAETKKFFKIQAHRSFGR